MEYALVYRSGADRVVYASLHEEALTDAIQRVLARDGHSTHAEFAKAILLEIRKDLDYLARRK